MKNYKWLVVVIVIVALLSAVWLAIKPEKCLLLPGKDRVVVIYLAGTIDEVPGIWFLLGITPRNVERQLDRAAGDARIRAVVLRINSGSSVATLSR